MFSVNEVLDIEPTHHPCAYRAGHEFVGHRHHRIRWLATLRSEASV